MMSDLSINTCNNDEVIYRPIEKTPPAFYVVLSILIGILIFAGALYISQLRHGLGITGMNRPVYWGFYIINFVFFIGVSHAGTLISAILRLCEAEWRRPITRMAEIITVVVLCIGGLHPVLDLGRPDRMLNLFKYGRLQSPLLWDVISVTAYFTASSIYLYLPLIPDIAILRDRGTSPHWLYEFLAWGWQGTEIQKKVLHRAMNILMIMVIPIAISVHTIIAYIFAMTLRAGWHSTIFGPYFVVGAIFSGIASIFIVLIVFRKIYHFENYLKPIHFQNLSKLLLVMSLVWFYFTFSEMLTDFFGKEPHHFNVLMSKLTGPYAEWFWVMFVCNFLLPVIILSFPKLRTISGIFVASCGVVVGMWIERYLIVVPSLSHSIFEEGIYHPALVEMTLFVGAVSAFMLGYMLFSKFFPLISIWEIEEGRKDAVLIVSNKIRNYQPVYEKNT